MSYAFRVNYNYKGRYLLTFSNRWDGVSWFSEGSKWDSFPAGAMAWRLSDEEFMESTRNWLSNAKLRVSYGITGNSGGTGAYVTQTQAYLYPNGGVTVGGKPVQFAQYTGTYAGSTLGWGNLTTGMSVLISVCSTIVLTDLSNGSGQRPKVFFTNVLCPSQMV